MNKQMTELADLLSIQHDNLPREVLAERVCEDALGHISELLAQVDRLRELSLKLCDAVENNDDLPPIKYALKCGFLVNQTRKAAQEQAR